MVAGFRQSAGTETDDPRFIELVGELSLVEDTGLLDAVFRAGLAAFAGQSTELASRYRTT